MKSDIIVRICAKADFYANILTFSNDYRKSKETGIWYVSLMHHCAEELDHFSKILSLFYSNKGCFSNFYTDVSANRTDYIEK